MKVRLIIKIFFLLLICNLSIVAQWVKANGPSFAKVAGFSLIDSTFYAGTTENIFISTDYGKNWVQSDSGFVSSFSRNRAFCFASIGYQIFAGTSSGIYSSSNKGKSWKSVFYSGTINDICFLDSTILAGGNGLYRSTNLGHTWSKLDSDALKLAYISSFVIDGEVLYASAGFKGVCSSTDNGLNWAQLNTDSPINTNFVVTFAVSGNNFLAGTNRGLYISQDKGENWDLTDSELMEGSILDLVVNGSYVYAGTSRGFYISSDNGLTWIQRNSGLSYKIINDIVLDGEDLYIGLWSGGVFHSSNDGISWSARNNGLPEYSLTTVKLYSTETKFFAGISQYGVFVSTDKGLNWSNSSNGLPFGVTASAFAYQDSNIFVGLSVNEIDGNGVYVSKDGGSNWNPANKGIEEKAVRALAVTDSTFIAGVNGGIYLSEDDGGNWDQTYSTNDNADQVNCFYVKNNNVFAGASDGVLRSTDYGRTWSLNNSGILSNKAVSSITSVNNTLYIGTVDGVYISNDNGENWVLFNTGTAPTYIRALGTYGNTIYAANELGLFLTINDGERWSRIGHITDDVSAVRQYDLLIHDSTMYVGTDKGIWHSSLSDLIVNVEPQIFLPVSYSLSQNYPNPFNPVTNIQYSIPEFSNVKIEVFDILGRKIETLINKEQSPGTYKIGFDGSMLSSGIYLYKITCDNFEQTKKMLLIK